METVKGILAFMVREEGKEGNQLWRPQHNTTNADFHPHHHHQACPLFGKLSDVVGRRTGLFLTVMGTTLPITALAVTQSMWIYAVAQGLSGVFASTFTITFAYIADLVEKVSR